MLSDILPWIGFLALVAVLLAIDLGVFQRQAHEVQRKEALIRYGAWVVLAALFNAGVYLFRGVEDGIEWTTGYLIEQSLSVDNVFVFLLIFTTFGVPRRFQHRVLFWGIIGVLVMRAFLITFAGVLLGSLHWMIYVFGAFLIVTGLKFLRADHEPPSLEKNRLVRLARRFFPVTPGYEGQAFFVKRDGRRFMTPLLLVLLLVESTDLVFAVDSVPAIYAVTDDPFIVFTSNIFAVLGLRALYFVIAGYLAELRYLNEGLAAILIFVGTKMVIADFYKIPALASLGVIVTILIVAFGASLLVQLRDNRLAQTTAEIESDRVVKDAI
jgi:tellurite resistance protein TerC